MKRQSWLMGSDTTNIDEITDAQANRLWNPITILYSKVLNGMFAKTDGQTKIVSDELCNLLTRAGKTIDPTDSEQVADLYTELKSEIQDVVTKTFTFKGYVSETEPSSASYTLNVGDMWINSVTMPTVIPIPVADIKTWNGTTWVAAIDSYTPATFDTFSDLEDSEGYYWFGGAWKVISTDLSLDYFSLNPVTGKWEIKNSVNLLGSPTTTTQPLTDSSTKLATTEFVKGNITSLKLLPGTIISWGADTVPAGYLPCDGSEVSREDYSDLFSYIGTIWGAGTTYYGWDYNGDVYYTISATPTNGDAIYDSDKVDTGFTVSTYDSGNDTITDNNSVVYTRNSAMDGSTTFNLPNLTNAKIPVGDNHKVKGDGKTLGLTDGSINISVRAQAVGQAISSGAVLAYTELFNKNIGTVSTQNANNTNGLGITTDMDKSGIVTYLSGVTPNFLIKY
jgi:microcystin-dependent protein